MRLALLAVVWMGLSCTGAGGAASSAAVNTAIAVMASGVSRASGGCYAACPAGTTCEPKTGYCVEVPCRGRCRADERCERVGALDQCVPSGTPTTDLIISPRKTASDAAK